MRHQVDGRQFGRNTSHRKAMFRNMCNALIDKEQIVTTLAKAKELRRVVERTITVAKRHAKDGEAAARRMLFDRTRDEAVVSKLFKTLADRYSSRNGGYTRILRMAETRRGDSAEMAVIELVDRPALDRKRKVKTDAKGGKGAKAAAEGKDQEGKDLKPADPFNKFRKLFGGKKKDAPGAAKGTKGGGDRKIGKSRGSRATGGGE